MGNEVDDTATVTFTPRQPSVSTAISAVVVISTFLTVFSIEFPIATNVSEFASINTEDLAILILFVMLIFKNIYQSEWEFTILLPRISIILVIMSVWILVTLLVASFRSSSSIGASMLWTLKWFEAVVLFFILQNLLDRRAARWLVQTLIMAGTLIAFYSVYAATKGRFRVRIFFDNPNTFAAFMTLIAIFAAAYMINYRKEMIKYGVVTALAVISVFTTGSRSGLLGLCIGFFVLGILMHRQLSRIELGSIAALMISALALIPIVVPDTIIKRITSWVVFTNGHIQLTDSLAARSFRTRIELTQESINLFFQKPVFGHGWFAVPSRVGYTDVYYTTVLIEVGLVGFLVLGLLALLFIHTWLSARDAGAVAIGSAGAAWYIALHAQALSGPLPRSPQILFISILVLVAAQVIKPDRMEPGSAAM